MRVLTLLCGDHPESERFDGLDPMLVVPDLCSRPSLIEEVAADTDRLVLGLHRGVFSAGSIQNHVRAAGIDPLGVPVVDLDGVGGGSRLGVTLAGAVARAQAFEESGPEHAKLTLPGVVTRRSLLTFTIPEYVAAPAIDPSVCAADRGCRACVDVCPREALDWNGGKISYDISICQPCGRCITVCPTGATVNPATTGRQIQGQIRAMVEAGAEGIAYVCRGSTRVDLVEGWYPVEVPCTGMVTATWLLAPLLMGVGGVTALTCADSGCPLAHDQLVTARLRYCRMLLDRLGMDRDYVPKAMPALVREPFPLAEVEDLFGSRGGAEMIACLFAVAGSPDVESLDSTESPVGIVEITAACTACTACAQTCPTGALAFAQEGQNITISFDPPACTACGQCVPRCPELERGAIALHRRTDFTALTAGRRTLHQQQLVVCELCGTPIGSASMMRRLGELLGEEHTSTMEFVSRRCLDCRGIG